MGNKNKHRQSGFETSNENSHGEICETSNENATNESVNSKQEVEQQEKETPTATKYKVAAGCSLTSKRGILSPGASVEILDEVIIKSLYERKLIVKV